MKKIFLFETVWKARRSSANSIQSLIDFFFPSCCTICFKSVNGALHICKECFDGVKLISGTSCSVCGMILNNEFQEENNTSYTCEECRIKPPFFTRACSASMYNSTMKKLVSLYKYNGKSFLAADLVHIIFLSLEGYINSLKIDLILYVPLHRAKLRERGFNQSFILAEKIGRRLGVTVPVEALVRTKPTETQTHFNREERAKNIKGSFSIKDKNLFTQKTVLLVDDVYTTGSTVNECSALISRAGAAQIYVITATRA